MKKPIVALALAAIVIALSVPAWAGTITEGVTTATNTEDITKKPITYEVRLTIKYNAVNEAEAAEINRKALARHGEACRLEVKIKKNRGNLDGLTVTGTSPTWHFVNPENNLYIPASGADLTSVTTLKVK